LIVDVDTMGLRVSPSSRFIEWAVVRPKSWTLGIINSRGPKKERTDEETSQVHA
jgi:hypothetical protein